MKKNKAFLSTVLDHKSVLVGALLIMIAIILALLAPIISNHDPLDTNGEARLSPPSVEYFMGTDQLGRDIMSRVFYGARASLLIGFSVVIMVTIFGSILGAVCGYFPKVDGVVMRVLDGFMAFPAIIIALTLAAIWGTGKINIIMALSFAYIPRMARVVRASALIIKEQDFVSSVKALGAKDSYVLFKYIIPNSFSSIIVQGTFIFAAAILDEAALSFLGVGIKAPEPSWGGMISEGRNYLTVAPWIILVPGCIMVLTIFGLNILGDGLRDITDPKFNRS